VFRLGWFADDFHLLDTARRFPLAQTLTGRFGIYPWYRPLSRELYYALIVGAGPFGLAFAHLMSVGCLFGCAWALMRLGARLLEPRSVVVAPILLVTYGFTKFLAGWSAGFQDLLALCLVLGALADHMEGRDRRALLWAALAPLAKETGFVTLPLMIAYEVLCRRDRRWRSWLPGQVAAWLAVAAIHVATRLGWHMSGTSARIERSPTGVIHGLGEVLGGFVGRTPIIETWAMVAAVVAGASAALLLLGNGVARPPARTAADHPHDIRTLLFLLLAIAAGLAPMLAGQLARLVLPHAYYAFPAVPWLALVAALLLGKLPRFLHSLLVPALVTWNTWCLGYSTPDLDYASWNFKRWDWPQAVRLSGFSRRLGSDVRGLLATRPESLVVVYRDLPSGSFFQTEDGPATRESLGDATVRAYYFRGLPIRVDHDHLAILRFDVVSRHLVPVPKTVHNAIENAAYAILAGDGWPAYAFASFADTTGPPRLVLRYLGAAARLIEEGPTAYRSGLAKVGVTDTTGRTPVECAHTMLPGATPLTDALAGALRRPLSAAAHSAYGVSLESEDLLVMAGVEYRIAITLDPARVEDRLRLASVLIRARAYPQVARAELQRVRRDAPGSEMDASARETIERLDAAEKRRAMPGDR
jgi:hypothetical protein